MTRLVPSLALLVGGLGLALGAARAVAPPSPAAAPAPPPPSQRLLLVAPPALDAAAAEWAAYRARDGWSVHRLPAGPGLAAEMLRSTIADAARAALAEGAPSVAVLLLGDADVIPTFRFAQRDPALVDRHDPEFASDHPYQCLDGDDLPDLALGRVPARSVEEALAVLDKIRRYETDASDPTWRSTLTFVAGEGRFGAGDMVLESLFRTLIDQMVPETFSLSMTYASPTSIYCPPPSALAETVLARFAEPALLVNYLGHGHRTGLDRMHWGRQRLPTLNAASAATLDTPRASLPIAFMGCCSVGWFDQRDGTPSLAEALLLAPGGPIALVAGSRPTHPYATAILQKDLARGLLTERQPTIGALDLAATRGMLQRDSEDAAIDLIATPIASLSKWPCSLEELRVMHARMYNLLGDPCTRIAHPAPAPSTLVWDGVALTGSVGTLAEGEVTVVIETARDAHAGGALVAASRADDPGLEALAAGNYPRANQRTLWTGTAPIRDGRFVAALPQPLPPGATIVRCTARATDGRVVRIGGMRFPPNAPAPGT